LVERRPQNEEPGWGKYLGLGLETAVGVSLGYLIGHWLDGKFGWTPWGVLVGTMAGVAGGMYLLIKEGIRMNRE
jgi:F0F1-type ATP synthase assembly protein I